MEHGVKQRIREPMRVLARFKTKSNLVVQKMNKHFMV